MPASRSALAAWHFSPGAINRLLPPWQDVQIEQNEPLRDGSRTVLGLKVGPMRIRWVAVHEQVKPGEQFVDRSVQGPFKQWVHEHSFLDKGALQSDLRDSVEYQLRFSAISDIFMGWKIRSDLVVHSARSFPRVGIEFFDSSAVDQLLVPTRFVGIQRESGMPASLKELMLSCILPAQILQKEDGQRRARK